MFAPLIAIALSIWGVILPFTITATTVEAQPATVGPSYVLAYAEPIYYLGQRPFACNITFITRHIAGLSPHQLQNLVTHEVFHCLGGGHLDGHPGIMNATAGSDFTGWDRWLFWHEIQPAPYRLFVAY